MLVLLPVATLGQDTVRDRVMQAINLPFPDQAAGTKALLSELGPKGAPFIAEVVKSRDDLHPIRKTFLIDILASMCGLEVKNAMFGLLADEDPYVRGLTTTYLAKRKLDSAIPHLIKLLDDKEVYKTINQTHPTISQDILIRDVAIDALATITGRELAPHSSRQQQAKAWQASWDKNRNK